MLVSFFFVIVNFSIRLVFGVIFFHFLFFNICVCHLLFFINKAWWLVSRVVSMLDSGAEGSGFKSHSRRCRVTVLGKLFTPIVSLFTKQRNW